MNEYGTGDRELLTPKDVEQHTNLTSDFEDPCASCNLLEKCVSGCLAQKTIAHGSLAKKPDPDCLGPNFQGDSA